MGKTFYEIVTTPAMELTILDKLTLAVYVCAFVAVIAGCYLVYDSMRRKL